MSVKLPPPTLLAMIDVCEQHNIRACSMVKPADDKNEASVFVLLYGRSAITYYGRTLVKFLENNELINKQQNVDAPLMYYVTESLSKIVDHMLQHGKRFSWLEIPDVNGNQCVLTGFYGNELCERLAQVLTPVGIQTSLNLSPGFGQN